jgi:hypothetical protein
VWDYFCGTAVHSQDFVPFPECKYEHLSFILCWHLFCCIIVFILFISSLELGKLVQKNAMSKQKTVLYGRIVGHGMTLLVEVI